MRKSWMVLAVLAMFLPVLFMGCEGDDGAQGPPGIQGPEGPQGPGAPSAPVSAVETCSTCHSDSSAFSASEAHSIAQVAVSSVVVTQVPTGVTITFNVKVGGVNANNFTFSPAVYRYAATDIDDLSGDALLRYNAGSGSYSTAIGTDNVWGTADDTVVPIVNDFNRVTLTSVTPAPTVVSNGNGDYTVTVDNTLALAPAPVTYMVTVANAAAAPRLLATAVGHLDDTPVRSLASNQACINCHSTNYETIHFRRTESGAHHGANPTGVEACTVCHTRYSSVSRGAGGDRLTAYVHGIHNAHAMPERALSASVTKPAGVYARNDSTNEANWFHTTYPTYMTDCSVCHDTPETLAIVNNAPVSGSLCLSCHDSMASWDFSTLTFHNAYTQATDCQQCHIAGGIARATVAEFHNGYINDPSHNDGQILDGRNVSFAEGKKFNVQITQVSVNTDNMAVTWTATYDGASINPCDNNVAAGPVFHRGGSTALSLLRAYGLGDDWVNDGIGTAPGQPVSTNLSDANTSCAGNAATTTIALTANEKASTATTAVVALQGKPTVRYNFGGTIGNRDIPVRAKTAVYEYVKSTGEAASTPRRKIVDTDLCLKCHVGSLYQHGGTRVDNVEMCVLCHNEASSETNVRVGMGVDPSEAYDGKAGQTYGFKSFLHALHSAGETEAPVVIYRTRGIYAWAKDASVLKNWPGTGTQVVFGSTTETLHNFHSPTYPRALNDCSACHPGDFLDQPWLIDQTKAVATTLNAGAEPWNNLADDVLEGPAAAACMSCHQSGDPATQLALKSHAYQFGWVPAVFPNGREDILNP